MYILPAIIFFHPELAKEALRYRSEMARGAEDNAKAMGSKGYKYPFRSAYTGREVDKLISNLTSISIALIMISSDNALLVDVRFPQNLDTRSQTLQCPRFMFS